MRFVLCRVELNNVRIENYYEAVSQELRYKCQNFATDLLDHTRTSNELEVLLNYDSKMEFKPDDKVMHLERLKLAIKLKQKEVGSYSTFRQHHYNGTN